MPPLEAHQKVFVSKAFLETTHGKINCVECHGGSGGQDRKTAHKNMLASPSTEKNSICSKCHEKFTKSFANTLHYNNKGIIDYKTGVIGKRANPNQIDALKKGLKNNCSSCHVQTCGECHITRPKTTGGGFVNGHNFNKSPNTVLNCTACHGSRLEKEYTGAGPQDFVPALQPDVHWSKASMQCVQCHTGEWFHSGAEPYDNRYLVKEAPRCESCHPNNDKFASVAAHKKHGGVEQGSTHLQCQVCHSQPYNNCSGCHVGIDKKNLPYYKTDKSWFDFKIGKNPNKTKDRPYDYVVLRHVPVAEDTFKFYGKDILTNYNALPTWKPATPHTILKITPQNQSCSNCHGNEKLFLLDKDVAPEEKEANKSVVMEKAP